jgi:succinyl-diaminopimelate desuccinylase
VIDDSALDRLALASPLLGATGWIDGLARLIAIDTSTTPGCYSSTFADALQDMFAPLGFGFRRLEVPPHRSENPASQPVVNMIAGRRTGRRVCTIYFHTDSQPAGEGWTRPPFTLTRQGSRLYGRGAADMKGAMAAVWAALRAADAVGLGLSYDPVLLFCTDWEYGQHPGLRHLVDEGLIEGHVMCLNGSVAPRSWAGSLGSVDIAIKIDAAPPAHPFACSNPIDAAAFLLSHLTTLKSALESRGLPTRPLDLPLGSALHAGLSVSSIQGGAPGTNWPTPCSLTVNRRYAPEEGFETVLRELQAAINDGARQLPGFMVDTSLTGHCAPVVDPDHGPNWDRWKQALSWGFGYPADNFRRWASSEASPMGFVQEGGVQEILLGGLRRSGSGLHGPDEFTTVEDVEALARSVLAYLSDVPEVPSY